MSIYAALFQSAVLDVPTSSSHPDGRGLGKNKTVSDGDLAKTITWVFPPKARDSAATNESAGVGEGFTKLWID